MPDRVTGMENRGSFCPAPVLRFTRTPAGPV